MFENTAITVSDLPSVGERLFNQLEQKYKTVLLIYSGIAALVILIGYVAFYISLPEDMEGWLIPIGILILVIISFIFYTSYFGFYKKRYQLRSRDVIFRSGLWWTSETSVPFVRVQHSEVIQGPIERMFGLSKLKLYTAGGHNSDLSIPGLHPDVAQDLKDYITKRVVHSDEEE